MAVSSTDSDCALKGARAVLVLLPRRRRRRRPHLAARAHDAAAAGGGALSDAAVWRELHGGECALRRHGCPCRRGLQRAEQLRLGPRPAAAPAGPLHARRPAAAHRSLSSLCSPPSLLSLLSRLPSLPPLLSLPLPRPSPFLASPPSGTFSDEGPSEERLTAPDAEHLPISPHISPYLEALVAQYKARVLRLAREMTRTQLKQLAQARGNVVEKRLLRPRMVRRQARQAAFHQLRPRP